MRAPHQPVMAAEVVQLLAVRPGGIYVDATVGSGGHAEMLLEGSAPSGIVIGCDWDDTAIALARTRLKRFGERMVLTRANFANLSAVLHAWRHTAVDGILADLGVSSMQIDTAERGFSFQRKGPLDMRMDTLQSATAADLVNSASEQELATWFRRYGEERFAERIARAIVRRRGERLFADTADFAGAVRTAIPAKYRHGKIDPATRAFQSLRIVVNGELINLERFLAAAPRCLAPGGRLAVMSYHSLEDRLVKMAFRTLAADTNQWRLLTKKPVTPGLTEVRRNPRARSAKFRVLERRVA